MIRKFLITLVLLVLYPLAASAVVIPLYDPYAIHQDGSDALTANWDAGAYEIESDSFTDGTATLTGGDLTGLTSITMSTSGNFYPSSIDSYTYFDYSVSLDAFRFYGKNAAGDGSDLLLALNRDKADFQAIDIETTGDVSSETHTFTGASSQDWKFLDVGTQSLGLQSQTAATSGSFKLFTYDGDATDPLTFQLYGKGTPSQLTDTETIYMGWSSADSAFVIRSLKAGSGDAQQIILYTESNTNQLYLDTDGQVGIGKVPTAALDVTGAITSDGTITGVTLTDDTASITGGAITGVTTLDADEVYNSAGNLKIEPDVQGEVILFGDTDIGDTTDGKSLYVYRMAAEGDAFFRVYVDQYRRVLLYSSRDCIFFSSNTTDISFYSTSNVRAHLGDAAGAKEFYVEDSANAKQFSVDSDGNTDAVGDFTAGTIQADNGFTGSWVNAEGDTVTVVGGVITGVAP